VKELPMNSGDLQTPPIDIISTPISLSGAWARAAGQREAQRRGKAREIEWQQNT